MAVDLMEIYTADFAEAVGRRRDFSSSNMATIMAGQAFDMRGLNITMIGAVTGADDPERFGLINAGIRVPTTVDHPGNPVSKA